MAPYLYRTIQNNMNSSLPLAGKTAIVTGASKGIGAGIARRLAADGAAVVVHYGSSREGADRTVAEIESAGGKAVAVQADMAKKSDGERLFVEARAALGPVDVLVNNAGVFEFLPLEDITEEHFHRQFNINVLGLILASQQAAAQFGPEGGAIINIGSVVGYSPVPTAAVYSATKAAVNAVTIALAGELGPRGIRVNAVNPGMVETEGFHAAGIAGSEFQKTVEAKTPLGRIGQPRDVAAVVAFLASPDAAWITGETYHLSGGFR